MVAPFPPTTTGVDSRWIRSPSGRMIGPEAVTGRPPVPGEETMKNAKKRRSGIDPLYLIIGGALVLLVILFTFMR